MSDFPYEIEWGNMSEDGLKCTVKGGSVCVVVAGKQYMSGAEVCSRQVHANNACRVRSYNQH